MQGIGERTIVGAQNIVGAPRCGFEYRRSLATYRTVHQVFKTMRGYGDSLQYSVFRCDLNKREMVDLREKLRGIIDHGEDRVLFVDVGPAATRGKSALWSMGHKR